jgi:hypothetical protein
MHLPVHNKHIKKSYTKTRGSHLARQSHPKFLVHGLLLLRQHRFKTFTAVQARCVTHMHSLYMENRNTKNYYEPKHNKNRIKKKIIYIMHKQKR